MSQISVSRIDTLCGRRSNPLGRLYFLVAFLAIALAAPLTASATEPTCEGFCGGQSPAGCFCDDLCTQYDDCCEDYELWCACEAFSKQVSIDGGTTWFDADDPASAPTQAVGGGAIYRFIVTNCFDDKLCVDTKINDPDLGIVDASVPGSTGDGILQPLETVVVTQNDPGFENLDQPDRCDTPGLKMNIATETTVISPCDPDLFDCVEEASDPAFLQCEGPFCGDGIVDPDLGETCDPPGSVPDPNFPDNECRDSCTYCGDGIVNNGEQCDDPSDPRCSDDCMIIPPFCGDGIVDPDETCDPPGSVPNTPPGNQNACRDNCTYCGDGIVNNGEECDDPNDPRCSNDCTLIPVCGDGIVDPGLGETCDPPGSVPDTPPGNQNACRESCTYCGDGIVNNGEECDDPNDPLCTDDCMLVPCGLEVAKKCALPPPPPAADAKCDGKLQEFTVIWNGDGPIDIEIGEGLVDSSASSANPGDAVTFFTDGSTNNTIVNIAGAGQSTFHVSCSDGDMDGATETNDDQAQVSPVGRDCGKDQGDGKGDSGFINQWLLEGFVDNSGDVLDCTADGDGGETLCAFNAIPASCDFPEKPDVLTFRVAGGDCSASDNDQKADKLTCTGGFIDPDEPVLVSVNGDPVFELQPGETFDVARSGDPTIELGQHGTVQFNKFHASCSQPLQAGDRYGANELLLLDGVGLGTNVTYSYFVTNNGPATVDNITVDDDQLGFIGSIDSLAPGESDTLTTSAFISETTTNVATVDGVGAPGAVCLDTSNPVTVDVLPPPPCDVGIELYKLEDNKIKWKLTNNSAFGMATLETFTLDFPSSLDFIKKVKLDGDIYKADDSDLVVGPGVTIGPNDWTKDDITKRQLDLGETRTLEVEFKGNDKNTVPSDFDLVVTFAEGCEVTAPKARDSDVAAAAGLGLACSATRLDQGDRLGLLLFVGALLLWSKRRRRTVVCPD